MTPFFFLKGIIIVNEKNKFLRFSTSDFFNTLYMIHSKNKIPIFDELPKYIMQYRVKTWDNK